MHACARRDMGCNRERVFDLCGYRPRNPCVVMHGRRDCAGNTGDKGFRSIHYVAHVALLYKWVVPCSVSTPARAGAGGKSGCVVPTTVPASKMGGVAEHACLKQANIECKQMNVLKRMYLASWANVSQLLSECPRFERHANVHARIVFLIAVSLQSVEAIESD